MELREIEYSFEGRRMVGQLAVDDSTTETRPAVLVCHEGNGISEHAVSAARRLAEQGYVAFALDYHGDGKMLQMDEVGERLGPLMGDPSRTQALGRAGLEILLASPYADTSRVASIGFCFGGTMSLELARGGEDLRAVVGFHSGLATTRPEAASAITGKVLVNIGSEDPIIPPEQRAAFEAEMRAGGVDWQMNIYGGCVHSFTNPAADGVAMPAIRYDATAARRSWQAMLELFGEVF